MTSKRCPTCKETKPVVEFYRNSAQRDGLSTSCQLCCKDHAKRWAAQNPERVREIAKRHQLKMKAARAAKKAAE